MVALTTTDLPGSAERRRAALGTMHAVSRVVPDQEPTPRIISSADGAASLDGLVCLVTGGARGIGLELARVFAAANAVVVIADRDPGVHATAASASSTLPRPLVGIQADVSDEADVAKLVSWVIDEFHRIDVVVNNAAIVHADPLLDVDLASWHRVFSVNVEGALLVTQAVARQMRTQPFDEHHGRRGAIVSVTSLAAECGRPLLAAYAASKAALNNLTASFAEELKTDGITVFGVCPGNHREGMWGYLGTLIGEASGRSSEEVEAERAFHSTHDFAATVANAVATPRLALNGTIVLWDGEVTFI